MHKILASSVSVLALAISSCPQAFGEIAGVDVAPGGVYISIEGGPQGMSAPEVAAHGAISTTQARVDGGYAGVFASAGYNGGVSTAQATSVAVATNGTFITAAQAISPPPSVAAYAQNGSASQTAYAEGGNFISVDDGPYAGFSVGYVFYQPFLRFFQRAELYGSFTTTSSSQSVAGAASGFSVDGNTAFASVSLGWPLAVSTYVKQRLDQDDFILRLKTENLRPGRPLAIYASFEPFYKYLDQDTAMAARVPLAGCSCSDITVPFPSLASRSAGVNGNLFGAQLALEASYPVIERVNWIGRASAGVYVLDAEGAFKDNFGTNNSITDDLQSLGVRLGAESGFRFTLSPRAWLSATGSVDYLSDVPTAVLPRRPTDTPAHVGTDEMTVYRATGRLTLAVQ